MKRNRMRIFEIEAMHREAQSVKDRLNALRDGASPAHAKLIDKLYSVADSNQSILRMALECLDRRTSLAAPLQ